MSFIIFIKALVLCLLFSSHAYADEVLPQITARLVKTAIAEGDFRQEKQLKVLRKPLISTGRFTYHHNKGVAWKTLTPISSLLLVNDTHLLTSQGEQTVPVVFGKIFTAMLGGDLAGLSDVFFITGTNQSASWQLQLSPKDELLKKVIDTMRLAGDDELRFVEIRESGGNISRIEFTRINHPAQLSPEQDADFARLSR